MNWVVRDGDGVVGMGPLVEVPNTQRMSGLSLTIHVHRWGCMSI